MSVEFTCDYCGESIEDDARWISAPWAKYADEQQWHYHPKCHKRVISYLAGLRRSALMTGGQQTPLRVLGIDDATIERLRKTEGVETVEQAIHKDNMDWNDYTLRNEVQSAREVLEREGWHFYEFKRSRKMKQTHLRGFELDAERACEGANSRGRPCETSAIKGSHFCPHHDPAVNAQRKAAR